MTLQQIIEWLELSPADVQSSGGGAITIRGVSTDTRTIRQGELYIPLRGERFDGHAFIHDAVQAGAAGVLCEREHLPGNVAAPVLIVRDTLDALQRLAHAYRRHLGLPVIAVTGSNGKTTTKDLIAAALSSRFNVHKTEGNLNNHIGVPLSLLSIESETDVAVIEMGMNHAGEISLLSRIAEPDFAVVTNVGEAHIGFFAGKDEIAQAKLEIADGLKQNGVLFINGDDALLSAQASGLAHPVLKVGLGEAADERAISVTAAETGATAFTSERDGMRYELPLMGKHNVTNALFALAVGRKMGLTAAEMAEGLAQVQLTGQRLQLRKTPQGMQVLDDSYNANPASIKAGIETLMAYRGRARKWVLLGDIMELGQHEEAMHRDIGRYVGKRAIECVFTVGDRARWIHEGALSQKRGRCVKHFASVEEAAAELLKREDPEVVLYVKGSRSIALERVVDALCRPAFTP